jgi:putative SOS response-associated peptidase YedK
MCERTSSPGRAAQSCLATRKVNSTCYTLGSPGLGSPGFAAAILTLMCGRYTRLYSWKQVHAALTFNWTEEQMKLPFAKSYNVAPTQTSPIVRLNAKGERELVMARWGLIPFWADDPSIGGRLINARADTIETKAAFRKAFETRRCLVPVSGFYEWQAVPGSKTKQPWYIKPADEGVMCFAGLWERWTKGDEPVESFTILTTDANEQIKPIHHRMPVIVQPEDYAAWLDPKTEPKKLRELLAPAPEGVLDAHRVSSRVNKPAFDAPECVEPFDSA